MQRRRQRGCEDRKPRRHESANEDAPSLPAGQALDRAVGHKGDRGPNDPHVDDIGPERQQAPVLKDQRLHTDDASQGNDGGPRSQQDRCQRGTQQMARRAAGDGEIQHLAGEDARRQDAHHRHLAFTQVTASPAQGITNRCNRHEPKRNRDGNRQKTVGDVHGENG